MFRSIAWIDHQMKLDNRVDGGRSSVAGAFRVDMA
jgi:hypothetical protein